VCVIVWAETGVLESEQIPTSCNLFHNQDLYIYSVLSLPHCQIIISAQPVHVSSRLFLLSCCACLPLPDTVFLSVTVLPALTLVPVSSPTSHQSCYSVLDSPLYPPLDALRTSTPVAPASASAPGFLQPAQASLDLHSIFPPCFNKYLGYLIPVSSSESALGFTCSAPRDSIPVYT
jgi:hypothetical protein